jgi:hypothetical protein
LQRSNDTHDEFDDFKIQRDKKEELKWQQRKRYSKWKNAK